MSDLQLWTAGSATSELKLEQRFDIALPDGSVSAIQPAALGDRASEVAALHARTVSSVDVLRVQRTPPGL